MQVPRPSLLDTQPPEGGEGLELPLKALSERFEVSLAEFGIIWIFVGVGQRHEDHPPLEGPECPSVDGGQTSEEICAACPREALYPVSNTSTTTRRRIPVVPGCGVLEGECRYRPPYGRGKVGNPLM
jgi:hypothetical protein